MNRKIVLRLSPPVLLACSDDGAISMSAKPPARRRSSTLSAREAERLAARLLELANSSRIRLRRASKA